MLAMTLRPLVIAAVAAALVGCDRPPPSDATAGSPASAASSRHTADAPSSDAKAPNRKTPEQRRTYKLDFTFTSNEAGKPPTSAAYMLNLEENNSGEIRLGSNIPLTMHPPPGAASGAPAASGARPSFGTPRQDVGFLLRCNFNLAGDDLLLHTDLEMSSADLPPAIHKMTLKGDAVVSPGKSSVVSTSEDPSTHQHYELSVTATKLR
jgi:hypothetical protein